MAAPAEVGLAFDALPLSAAVLNRRGEIIATNQSWRAFAQENGGAAERTGYGINYLDICAQAEPDPSAVAAGQGLKRVLQRDLHSFQLEYPCHSPDEQRWFLMHASPLRHDGGGGGGISTTGVEGVLGIEGAVVSHLNITARRQSELAMLDEWSRKLQRSNEDLSAFARIVAHDLKEPLRGMGSYASYVLEEEATLSQAARDKLEVIARLAKRTTGAIDGLLQLARVDIAELTRTEVDLGEVAAEVIDSFRPQLEAAGARATIRSPLPMLKCDACLVRAAMANMVSNAIKYNDKAEKIIEIGPAERGSGFYVRDNGIGISSRGQKRLFEVFTQLQPRGRYGEGAGLGLSIVKRVVERHHGTVRVESVEGEGTTLTVILSDEQGQTSSLIGT